MILGFSTTQFLTAKMNRLSSAIFSPNLLDFLLRLGTYLMLSTRPTVWVNEQSTSLDVYEAAPLMPCLDSNASLSS